MDLSNNQSFNRNNSLLNAENNTEFHNSTWRKPAGFLMRYDEEKASTAAIPAAPEPASRGAVSGLTPPSA